MYFLVRAIFISISAKLTKVNRIGCINLNKHQINNGINEIKKLFNKKINFVDKLISIKYIKKS